MQGSVTVGGDILPSSTGLNLGSSSQPFAALYVDQLSAASADVDGTSNKFFTVDTDQGGDNADTSGVRFYLGPVSDSYAALQWNGAANEFQLLGRESSGTPAALQLPTSSDVLVGRNTDDTLTNKTLSGAAVTGSLTGVGNPNLAGFGTINGQTISGAASLTGTLSVASGLTVESGGLAVQSGGAAINGDTTINGSLSGLTGLTVVSGGASVGGDVSVSGNVVPSGTTSTVGTPASEFSNGYFKNLTVDDLTASSTSSDFTSPLLVTTTTQPQMTIRYDYADYFDASVSPTGQTTLDATGSSAGFLFGKAVSVPSLQASTATISGGSINGTSVGSSSPDSGAFTTLTASSGLTVSSGGASITGNSTVSGSLSGLTGLTVVSGGASVGGGVAVAGNLTATGNVNGAAISGGTVSGGSVTGGSLYATGVNGLSVAAGVISSGEWLGGQVDVKYGGTGNGSFATDGVLYGNGSSALQVTVAGTPGQVLASNASGVPTFVSVSGDASVSSTGALTLAASGVGAAGTVGNSTQVPVISYDSKGRITGASETTVSGVVPGGLAGGDDPNDASLTFGSAPPIHALTKAGALALVDASILSKDALKLAAPKYGPKNWHMFRHEMFVTDIRIWLATLTNDCVVLRTWRHEKECELAIPGGLTLRPDGAFVLDIGQREGRQCVLAGFVEADRGTERGLDKWTAKVRAYAALFADPANVVAATGFRHARLLVVTRTEARRDWIWEAVEQIGADMGLGPEILERLWIAENGGLDDRGLGGERWRIPGVAGLWGLV